MNLFDGSLKGELPQYRNVGRSGREESKKKCCFLMIAVTVIFITAIGRLYLRAYKHHEVTEFLRTEIEKIRYEVGSHENRIDTLADRIEVVKNFMLNDDRPTVSERFNDMEEDFNFQIYYDEKLQSIFVDLDRIDNALRGSDAAPPNASQPQFDTSQFDTALDDSGAYTRTDGPINENVVLSRIDAIHYSLNKLDAKIKWIYEKLKKLGHV